MGPDGYHVVIKGPSPKLAESTGTAHQNSRYACLEVQRMEKDDSLDPRLDGLVQAILSPADRSPNRRFRRQVEVSDIDLENLKIFSSERSDPRQRQQEPLSSSAATTAAANAKYHGPRKARFRLAGKSSIIPAGSNIMAALCLCSFNPLCLCLAFSTHPDNQMRP